MRKAAIQTPQDNKSKYPFDFEEEESIIALALDSPEFFASVNEHISPEHFKRVEAKYLIALFKDYIDKHQTLPTRKLLKNLVSKDLGTGDEYEPVLELIDTPSNPRVLPFIKESVLTWVKHRAYGSLFTKDIIDAYKSHEYDKIEALLDKARTITNITSAGSWFFKDFESLFDETIEEKLTTGFSKLDNFLNEGGPSRKEVVMWMAPTGVGKSLMLVHNGVACLRRGLKVLHITLETAKRKIATRYMGAISRVRIKDRISKRTDVAKSIKQFRTEYSQSDYDLHIVELPPDETSVGTIKHYMEILRRVNGWVPDVVIIDYLELMAPKRKISAKDGEYHRQKVVSTELCGLAKQMNVLIYSASQSNRSGAGKRFDKGKEVSDGAKLLDLTSMAESFGKSMPIDYIISMNQEDEEYNMKPHARIRLYIIKNRNGPKLKKVAMRVDYETMYAYEEAINSV